MYRGRDIQWWMDASGLNDEPYDQVENPQGFDEIRVVGSDLFAMCGREVCRFEESPIFDVVSVP
jgi:hypothetical protein